MKRPGILRRWLARKFGVARLLCLALLIAFVALRIADPAPIYELRDRTFDAFQLIRPRAKMAKSPVIIVDIDDGSLTKLGQWPWPRTRIANLVAGLTRLGALAIGFDIIFSEPDRLNLDVSADVFRSLDEATRERLRSLPIARPRYNFQCPLCIRLPTQVRHRAMSVLCQKRKSPLQT
jgi:adenylate cyclase